MNISKNEVEFLALHYWLVLIVWHCGCGGHGSVLSWKDMVFCVFEMKFSQIDYLNIASLILQLDAKIINRIKRFLVFSNISECARNCHCSPDSVTFHGPKLLVTTKLCLSQFQLWTYCPPTPPSPLPKPPHPPPPFRALLGGESQGSTCVQLKHASWMVKICNRQQTTYCGSDSSLKLMMCYRSGK